MKEILKSIGLRIRNYRIERKLTQAHLATMADVHETFIGKVERGERNLTVDSLLKITGALDVTLDELFKHLQPKTDKAESTTLPLIISQLQGRSLKEQKKALALIELMFNDKF